MFFLAHDLIDLEGERAAAERHPLHSLDGVAETLHFAPGQNICAEASVCNHWYRLVQGSACRSFPASQGMKLTLDVLAPGEYFGFYVPDLRGFCIEAGDEGATVRRYPRWCIEFLAEVEPATRARLNGLVRQASSRMRTSLGRIAAFTLADVLTSTAFGEDATRNRRADLE
jgi:CRP-like cAMP-binding protein